MSSVTKPIDSALQRLIWRVVYFYYIREPGLSPAMISEKLNISRIKVSRLLRLAREMGMIRIVSEPPRMLNLESQLIDKFNLRDARVVMTVEQNVESVRRIVAHEAAIFFQEVLDSFINDHKGRRISVGIAGGTTLYLMLESLQPMRYTGLDVMAMAVGPIDAVGAGTVAEVFASKYDPHSVSAYTLIKFIPDGIDQKRQIIRQSQIQEFIEKAKKVDVALVGMGNLHINSTLGKTLSALKLDVERLKKNGIVGDISSDLLMSDGSPAKLPAQELIIGVTAEELRNLHQIQGKRVIGVGGGTEKFEIIRAVLMGGSKDSYIDSLVTDEFVAKRLLES